ncbi:MAG: hypothetical protein E7069_07155 [Bacteroidales bacterium]|nr:hypothetical protein [Bacteroidales bacterium]
MPMMTRSIILLLLCIFPLLTVRAQLKREIERVEPFTQITVASGINLIIHKADKRRIVVEGERGAINNTICAVDSAGMLSIFANKFKYRRSKRINVYVDYDSTLTYIASTSSRIRCESPIEGERFEVKSSYGSEYYFVVDVASLVVHLENNASLQVSGNARSVNAFLDESSILKGFKLEADVMEVTLDNSSEAEVNVASELNIYAQHQSVVKYDGDPAIHTKMINSSLEQRFRRSE